MTITNSPAVRYLAVAELKDRERDRHYTNPNRGQGQVLTCICSGQLWPPDAVRPQLRRICDPIHIVLSPAMSDAPRPGTLHYLCWSLYRPLPWARFYLPRLELEHKTGVIRYGEHWERFLYIGWSYYMYYVCVSLNAVLVTLFLCICQPYHCNSAKQCFQNWSLISFEI